MGRPERSASHRAAELKRLRETSVGARGRLSHENSVYQEEMLAQNEALMRVQEALEATRDEFIELYDFAPNAYLTLDEQGVIRRCNLTAAALLGRSREAVEGYPLVGFVTIDSRRSYADFLRRCRSDDGVGGEIELALQTSDQRREVQIRCRRGGGAAGRRRNSGAREYFTSIVDITDRRELERERARTAQQQVALTERLLTAIEDERLRIARNLHDDIGQQITAIRLTLESVVQQKDESMATSLGQVQRLIEHLDERLHFVAAGLRPTALDLGLVTAVDQYVRDWSATFDKPAAFYTHGVRDGDVAAAVEVNLYRIVQEALNNVAKHAGADRVSVLLEKRGAVVVLIVEDDGRGFDLEEKRADGSSLGLVGMRERAQMVGGRLEIETSPGHGTSVFVHVPSFLNQTGPAPSPRAKGRKK